MTLLLEGMKIKYVPAAARTPPLVVKTCMKILFIFFLKKGHIAVCSN